MKNPYNIQKTFCT